MLQLENNVSEEKRKELLKEQERLLLKMERKGEQINKLYKYKSQVGYCIIVFYLLSDLFLYQVFFVLFCFSLRQKSYKKPILDEKVGMR